MKRKVRLDRVALLISVPTLVCSVALNITLIQKVKTLSEINIHDDQLYILNNCVHSSDVKSGASDLIETTEIVLVEEEPELLSLGEFRLTGYCSCEKCCGQWADGITATGTVATAGRTIAVDPNIIPLGSKVIINGNEYIAEDTGSAINQKRIDIYCDSHGECFSNYCNGYAEVFLVND